MFSLCVCVCVCVCVFHSCIRSAVRTSWLGLEVMMAQQPPPFARGENSSARGQPDPLLGLNEDQRAAVLSEPDVPLVIFAGAGSGKTRTLCRRIAFALQCGEHPSSILCLTFSRNAADELRQRVAGICSDATARQCTVSTFHSFLSLIHI